MRRFITVLTCLVLIMPQAAFAQYGGYSYYANGTEYVLPVPSSQLLLLQLVGADLRSGNFTIEMNCLIRNGFEHVAVNPADMPRFKLNLDGFYSEYVCRYDGIAVPGAPDPNTPISRDVSVSSGLEISLITPMGMYVVDWEIRVTEIAPTPTPTLVAVPGGCYVEQLADHPMNPTAITLVSDSYVYSWSGVSFWESGSNIWQELPPYGTLPFSISAGQQIFRPSAQTYMADILVCESQATPTPTGTATTTAPPHRCVAAGPDWRVVIDEEYFYLESTYLGPPSPSIAWNIDSIALYGLQHDGIRLEIFDYAYAGQWQDGGPLLEINNVGYTGPAAGSRLSPVVPFQEVSAAHPANSVQVVFKQFYDRGGEYNAGYLCGQIHLAGAPTPTVTSTPSNTPTASNTRTRTPTRTATATRTSTPTRTPGPGLGCISTEYQVPVTPATASATLYNNAQFQVLDEPIYVTLGGTPYRLDPAIYTWQGTSGDQQLYSQTAPARLFVCLPIGVSSPTSTATATPTRTATPSVLPTPSIPCEAQVIYQVSASPIAATLYQNLLYQALDQVVEVQINGAWYPIYGVGMWDASTGAYQVRSSAPARLAVCVGGTPTGTPTGTRTATATGTATETGTATVTPTPMTTCPMWETPINGGVPIVITQTMDLMAVDTQFIRVIVISGSIIVDPPTGQQLAVGETTVRPIPITVAPVGGSATARFCAAWGMLPSPTSTSTPTPTPTASSTPTATPGAVGLRWSTASTSVNESSGLVLLVVLLSPVQTEAVSVSYSSASLTAQAGLDFAPRDGTITFAPGQTSIQIAIPILDDLAIEGDEAFNVSLYDPRPAAGRGPGLSMLAHQGDGVGLGEPSTERVTILDNDAGTVVPTVADMCVLVPPSITTLVTPFPTLPLELPTLRPLPDLPSHNTTETPGRI
jgi:hypothetical protein